MHQPAFIRDPLASELKHLIAGHFHLSPADPDLMPDNAALIGADLGLDPLDALEVAMCVEERFNVIIPTAAESRPALASIRSLAAFIRAQRSEALPGQPAAMPWVQTCAS